VKLKNLWHLSRALLKEDAVMARKDVELRPVMTRIPESLRRRLDREADRNRRSMNAEIIHRLEESFAPDPLFEALTGGAEAAAILRLIASAMQLESAGEDGTPWNVDPGKAEAVRTAACLIIAAFAGLPQVPPPLKYDDGVTELRPAERGLHLAKYLLERSSRKPSQEESSPKRAGEQSQ
jgi:hypothetical protein